MSLHLEPPDTLLNITSSNQTWGVTISCVVHLCMYMYYLHMYTTSQLAVVDGRSAQGCIPRVVYNQTLAIVAATTVRSEYLDGFSLVPRKLHPFDPS